MVFKIARTRAGFAQRRSGAVAPPFPSQRRERPQSQCQTRPGCGQWHRSGASRRLECHNRQIVDRAAKAAAELLGINAAEALNRCRQLPLVLGERVDARERDRIEARFADASLPLQRTTYVPLAWQMGRP